MGDPWHQYYLSDLSEYVQQTELGLFWVMTLLEKKNSASLQLVSKV